MKRRGNVLSPIDTIDTLQEMLVATDSSVEDGEQVYVRLTQQWFVYRVNSGLTPDGINVIASLYGEGVWQLLNIGPGGTGGVSAGYAAVDTPITTNSATFTDLLSFDYVASGTDSALFWASVCCSADFSGSGLFRMTFDGNPLGQISWTHVFSAGGDSVCGGTQVPISAPSAGMHTVAIQWAVGPDPLTLSVTPSAFEHANLMSMFFGF
jgi:hypothetical protein